MKIKTLWLVYLFLAIILLVGINIIKPNESKTKYSDSDSAGIEKAPVENSSNANKTIGFSSQSGGNTTTNNMQKNSGQGTKVAQSTLISLGKKENGFQNTPKPEPVIPEVVGDKANSIAKGEVQTGDFMEVIKILQGKLSLEEIKYLFDSARDDYWVKTPVQDIENARHMLFSKLSGDDLDKLDQLGRKYGRSMTILKKDIDVAKIKEEQMRKEGVIN